MLYSGRTNRTLHTELTCPYFSMSEAIQNIINRRNVSFRSEVVTFQKVQYYVHFPSKY